MGSVVQTVARGSNLGGRHCPYEEKRADGRAYREDVGGAPRSTSASPGPPVVQIRGAVGPRKGFPGRAGAEGGVRPPYLSRGPRSDC